VTVDLIQMMIVNSHDMITSLDKYDDDDEYDEYDE